MPAAQYYPYVVCLPDNARVGFDRPVSAGDAVRRGRSIKVSRRLHTGSYSSFPLVNWRLVIVKQPQYRCSQASSALSPVSHMLLRLPEPQGCFKTSHCNANANYARPVQLSTLRHILGRYLPCYPKEVTFSLQPPPSNDPGNP